MRCSCIKCGAYMVQKEKGTQSCCVCPECFMTCSACMGTGNMPLEIEDLKFAAMMRENIREHENIQDHEDLFR